MSVFSVSSLSASDVYPTRRVKPLPKRRRTSLPSSEVHGLTTDTLLASPTYPYAVNDSRTGRLRHNVNAIPSPLRKSLPFTARPRITEDVDGEGDYTDHLQQPNNTKKRKVPAAAPAATPHETTVVQGNDDLIDENISQDSQVNLSGKGTEDAGASLRQELDFQPAISRRKTCSLVTLATLRLKELLKARRKMMAAVIHDNIDPLALEFALSAPFAPPPAKQLLRAWSYGPRFRRHPRNRAGPAVIPRELCFSGHFSFAVPSSSTCLAPSFCQVTNPSTASRRYISAKKAAAGLQLRFQTELAHQAATAAENALKTASKLSHNSETGERRKMGSEPNQVALHGSTGDKTTKKQGKTKKKKRSAMANASNPHHLRNYIPSRVSYLGGHSASSAYGQAQSSNTLGPLALKFLSATLPPRRKGRILGVESLGPSLVQPETEWICPFCEYSLFYSDDAAMQRAVKNRRRILVRRRNARERAAAAASGTIPPRSQDILDDEVEGDEDEDEDEDEDSCNEGSSIVPATTPLPRKPGTIVVRQENRGPHPGG